MVFDVLTQPWIPLITQDGALEYAGIARALANAHTYTAIRGDNPLVTYGIHRLLLAFLQEVFRPEDVFDKADIVSRGQFDSQKLDAYYEQCRKHGECFDLFDPSKPFLQHAFEPEDETKTSHVSSLFIEMPTGNNHVHFNHQLEQDSSATPSECLRALCTIPAFQLSHGRSAHTSVNGIPPKYFLFSGRNLFETLACSMVSKTQIGNLSYDVPPPAWRDEHPVPNRGTIATVSLLHGLTARPLRIQLLRPDEGDVSQVMMAHGYDYRDLQNWTDPHTAYMLNQKNERFPLQCKEGRAVWRDIGTILKEENRPMFLQNVDTIIESLPGDEFVLGCQVFGLVSMRKTLLVPVSWEEESLPLYRSLLASPEQVQLLQLCMECMNDIASALSRLMGKSVKKLQDPKEKDDKTGQYQLLAPQVETAFLELVRHYLLNVFVQRIDETFASSADYDVICRLEFGRHMRQFALSAFQEVMTQMGQNAPLLKWRSLAEHRLRQDVYKILRKGGFVKDD